MKHAVFGIVGWKDSGKTTLAEGLLEEFTNRGITISLVKHTHHNVDVDRPGTDSYRHRVAGAREVVLASGSRFALMHEYRNKPELELADLLDRMAPCDLVLVEGFKRTPIPKIEVHRKGKDHELIATFDSSVVAIVADFPIAKIDLPFFKQTEVTKIADFIRDYINADNPAAASS